MRLPWLPLLAFCALLACSKSAVDAPAPPRLTAWVEYLTKEEFDGQIGFAAKNALDLNVSIVKGQTDRAYIKALCESTAKSGVHLRFWPGLSHDDGYWPNQANVDVFLTYVDELLAIAKTDCPSLTGVVVDMEMPIYRVEELQKKRAAGATAIDVGTFLIAAIDRVKFERARGLYAAYAKKVHAAGLTYSVTTPPMLADDYDDEDETIAMAFWTPIEGVDWDVVSFQVYRTLFDGQFPDGSGKPYTSGLIATYARSIIARWGDKAGVDLGTTGSGIGIPAGLANARELQNDIAAALGEGIAPQHIAIYSLEGLKDKPDAAAWVKLPPAKKTEPATQDEDAHTPFRTLDALQH